MYPTSDKHFAEQQMLYQLRRVFRGRLGRPDITHIDGPLEYQSCFDNMANIAKMAIVQGKNVCFHSGRPRPYLSIEAGEEMVFMEPIV